MKKLVLTIVLIFTVQFAGQSLADPYYEVKRDNTRITEHPDENGDTRCTVNAGDKVQRVWDENSDVNIYVKLMHPAYEFWKKCNGWIRKSHVRPSTR